MLLVCCLAFEHKCQIDWDLYGSSDGENIWLTLPISIVATVSLTYQNECAVYLGLLDCIAVEDVTLESREYWELGHFQAIGQGAVVTGVCPVGSSVKSILSSGSGNGCSVSKSTISGGSRIDCSMSSSPVSSTFEMLPFSLRACVGLGLHWVQVPHLGFRSLCPVVLDTIKFSAGTNFGKLFFQHFQTYSTLSLWVVNTSHSLSCTQCLHYGLNDFIHKMGSIVWTYLVFQNTVSCLCIKT